MIFKMSLEFEELFSVLSVEVLISLKYPFDRNFEDVELHK